MNRAIKLTLISVMVLAITFAFVGVCFSAGANISYAAEPTVYSFTDSDGVDFVVTIIDGESCSVVYGENSATLKYTINGTLLTLNNEEKGTSLKFTIGEGNKLTKYVETVIEDVIDQEATIKTKVSEYLSKYLGDSIIVDIVTWSLDVLAIIAMVVIYFVYRKYKDTTIGDIANLAKDKISVAVKEKFGDLQGDIGKQLEEYSKQAAEITEKINTLLKAYALSQDKSADGKIAMLNLLQGTTEDEQVEEKIVEMKEEIVETQEAVDEIVDKVEGEYTEIF